MAPYAQTHSSQPVTERKRANASPLIEVRRCAVDTVVTTWCRVWRVLHYCSSTISKPNVTSEPGKRPDALGLRWSCVPRLSGEIQMLKECDRSILTDPSCCFCITSTVVLIITSSGSSVVSVVVWSSVHMCLYMRLILHTASLAPSGWYLQQEHTFTFFVGSLCQIWGKVSWIYRREKFLGHHDFARSAGVWIMVNKKLNQQMFN